MRLLKFLAGLLLGLLLVQLSSCGQGDKLTTVLTQPVDSTVQHQVATAQQQAIAERWAGQLAGSLSTGKVKFNGPVTFQVGGTGNNASSTSADKAKAAVAAAPGAVATDTRTSTGPPWYVYLVLAVVCFFVGAGCGGYFMLKITT